MRQDTTDSNGDDHGGAQPRRWSAGVAAVVAVVVAVVGAATPVATTALVPQPTTASPPNRGGPHVVHDLPAACRPGDDTETVLLFVAIPGPTTDFAWTITDGQRDVIVSDPSGHRW